jgi:Fur family transcriptional regulator, ferric uptake regulator
MLYGFAHIPTQPYAQLEPADGESELRFQSSSDVLYSALMDGDPQPVRLPKNYQLVYDLVLDAGKGVHLTTSDLFALAKSRRPEIGFSTVYRGIQRLRDLGLIDEIVVPGAEAAVYEPASGSHAHFRCTRCGKVEDVNYSLSGATLSALAKQTGAHIETASVTLHGECRSCR